MGSREKVPIITKEDIKLFKYLNTFKFLDYTFIEKYIYSKKNYRAVSIRCNQLKYHNYIDSIKIIKIKEAGTNKNTVSNTVVFLSEEGEKILRFNLVDVNYLLKDYSEHYIKHQLFLANMLVHYHDAEITDVKEENTGESKEVNIYVDRVLSETEVSYVSKETNIRPDGGIILSVDGKKVLYFIEAERSYSTKDNISRKLIRQYSMFDNSIARDMESLKDEKIASIRVLFISENENKMNNLINKINEIEKENDKLNFNMLFIYQEEILRQIEEFNDNILGVKYYNLDNERVKIYGRNN